VIQVDIAIPPPESAEPRHQPQRCKRGGRRNRDIGALRTVFELLAQPPDLLEARAQHLEQIDTFPGQFDAAMVPQEQRAVELGFKPLDLAAHRAQGYAEFARGRGEAAVTRTGVEGIETGQAR
jgi:hypothetical protein